jgi:hypothetical protein
VRAAAQHQRTTDPAAARTVISPLPGIGTGGQLISRG